MPFALVFMGLVMIVSGARDTHAALGKELVEDFTGPGNFLYWIAAIGALGALGSIPQFRDFSRWFMALVIIAMVVNNGGFFAKLSEALRGEVVSPEKSNANYVVGNTAANENTRGGNVNNASDPVASFLGNSNIGTAESRENAATIWNVAKWFI